MSRQRDKEAERKEGGTTRNELGKFKDLPLPEITNKAIKSELISGMGRKAEKSVREAIMQESDKTIHHGEGELEIIPSNVEVDDLYVGMPPIEIERYVRENDEIRKIIEKFVLEEKVSSESNMAGDVYRATRFWDGNEYGTVVLKTPKKKHLYAAEKKKESILNDAYTEIRNLHRFRNHPHILQQTGDPFILKDERPVAQMEYLPRSFDNYLLGIETEGALTKAVLGGGIQLLKAIHYMENLIDNEGPRGWTHIDMKESNMKMDLVDGRWVIKLIDLDSAVPSGPRDISKIRYTAKYVDPEKIMNLHLPELGVIADPAESIYSMGLTLLYSIATRIGVRVRRHVDISKLINGEEGDGEVSQRLSRVSVYGPEELKMKIELRRAIDERNLLQVYYLNEARRVMEFNIDDIYSGLPGVKKLIDVHKEELLAENPTVHPCVFEAIRECLKLRAQRPGAEHMAWKFNEILQNYIDGKYDID